MEKTNKIKIGLVGVGKLGAMHAASLAQNPQADLVGVFDSDAERCRAIAEKHRCTAFASVDALLQEVEAVGVIVPTTLHTSVALQALSMGKPVFVEKPIAATVTEAEQLVAAAGKSKTLLQVGHIERFNPAIRALDGRPIAPRFIESHRLAPFDPRGTDVAVVLDLMIHDIDLILDFVNSPLSAVRANGAGILTPTLDIANARLEFACGTVANVTSSRVSLKQERRLRFFQKDAYISLDLIAKRGSVVQRSEAAENLLRQKLRSDEAVKPEELVETQSLEPAPEDKDALALELEAWVDAVLSNTKPVVDGQAGLRAMRAAALITDAINQQPNIKYG